jgi:hypothetical protein
MYARLRLRSLSVGLTLMLTACLFLEPPDDGTGEVRGRSFLDASTASADDGGLADSGNGAVSPTTAQIQALFERWCDDCHISRDKGRLRLNEPFVSRTVNVDADQANLKLVAPGDRERSYLFLKILGTHRGAGGSGERMPEDGPPYLSREDVELIGAWIDSL